jgi:hypothetical protein
MVCCVFIAIYLKKVKIFGARTCLVHVLVWCTYLSGARAYRVRYIYIKEYYMKLIVFLAFYTKFKEAI